MNQDEASSAIDSQEGHFEEVRQLNDKIMQLEERKMDLIREVTYLRTILTSFTLETSTRVHQLYSEGVIKSQLVYRTMHLVSLSLFDDTSAINGIEDYAKLLSQLEPFIKVDARILVLINSFSGFYFVALALMSGRDFEGCLDHDQNTSQTTCGCVIGRVKRQDIKVIKEKYDYLLNKGRMKLNAFAESAGENVLSKGYPKCGPYDLILVPQIGWANGLATQLKTRGVIVNPFSPSDILQKDTTGRLVSM